MDTTDVSPTGKRADWCRIVVLSSSMDPTQSAGNHSWTWMEQRGTRMQMSWRWLGTTQRLMQGYLQICWTLPREYWPKYSYHWRGASFLVPVRDVSENLASATSGQPWNLQPSRRITAEVGCSSNGCRLSWPWAHLQNGLEHDVPESMIARRKAAQIQAYEPPRSHLMHYTEVVWRQLGALFLE